MGTFFIAGLILAYAVSAGTCWLCWQLLRQNGRILLRLDELEERLHEKDFAGLAVGSAAPDFNLPGLTGERSKLSKFRGRSLLLIFFNPECRFCRALVPKLAALESEFGRSEVGQPHAGRPLPVIIAQSDVEQTRELCAEHRCAVPILLDQEATVSSAYGVKGTPGGYLIDQDGKIASELALGAGPLLALAVGTAEGGSTMPKVDQGASHETGFSQKEEDRRANRFSNHSLAGSKINRDGLKVGTPAPDFHLRRLDRPGDVSLASLRGHPVAIIFSSPSCEPCNQLAPRLEQFYRRWSRPQLIMISSGEPDENQAKVREHGLSFPVVLQHAWATSRSYATFATPAAYLIDHNGLIAHEVAIGPNAILEMLGNSARRFEKNSAIAEPNEPSADTEAPLATV